jgi:hypothetical protein
MKAARQSSAKPPPKPKAGDRVVIDVHYNGAVSQLYGKLLKAVGSRAIIRLDDGRMTEPFISQIRKAK